MAVTALQMSWRGGLVGVVIAALGQAPEAHATCVTLISGAVVYDVQGCKQMEPEKFFDTKKDKYAWIDGLEPAGRKKFLDSYRGLLLKGRVAKSKAAARGLDNEEAALNGQNVYMYIGTPTALQCNAIIGRRLAANLKQVCCDGAGEPPCLYETSYLLQQAQVMPQGAGDAAKGKAKHSKDYLAGDTAYREHKWKLAAQNLERARVNSELDIPGYYHLGNAYRQLDQCSDAVLPLRYINEQSNKKQIWAEDEPDARAGIFLLARCYAKMNDPEKATQVLNTYLLEPAKYRDEINSSLRHKDFGWIHTSREYLDYQKLARQKLSTLPPEPEKK